jgi:hypothetical protein
MQALQPKEEVRVVEREEDQHSTAAAKTGCVGQAMVSAIHGANVGLLYSVLTSEWLFDVKSHKRENGLRGQNEAGKTDYTSAVKERWSEVKHGGRRFLDLSWRFGEYDASRAQGKSKSVWLTLHTTPPHDAKDKANKGKERIRHGQNGNRRLVGGEVESDEVLKLVEIDNLGRLGRGLLVGACVVPILPEMLVALAFFWATYLLGIAYALTAHRKSGNYALLGLLAFVHLPFLWVLWFPLVLLAFLGIVLFQSLRSRAHLATDARKVFGWLAGKESGSVLPSHVTTAKND